MQTIIDFITKCYEINYLFIYIKKDIDDQFVSPHDRFNYEYGFCVSKTDFLEHFEKFIKRDAYADEIKCVKTENGVDYVDLYINQKQLVPELQATIKIYGNKDAYNKAIIRKIMDSIFYVS